MASRVVGTGTSVTVDVVSDADVFGTLREEWNTLLAASKAETIFLTWEWLHTWWTHFSAGRRLSILSVRRSGELVAVFPLARRRSWPLLPSQLEFLGTGAVGSDYLDFVARRGSEQEALGALANLLERQGVALELRQVRAQHGLAAELATTLQGRGWKALGTRTDICPFIAFAGQSWETYLASLGRAHRSNFKRRLSKLREEFDVRFEAILTEERRRDAINVLFDLHAKRWEPRGGSKAFTGGQTLRFHEELSRLALGRGWLRLFILWLSGQPAAALYGFRYGRTFYLYQTGFDPRFARWSVGLVTTGLTIKSAIGEGAQEFDFLHGSERYKSLWACDCRDLVRLEVDPPGASGTIRRWAMERARAARQLTKRVLPPPVADKLAAWRSRFLHA